MLKSDEIVNNIASIAATIDLDLVDEITIPVVFHVIVPPSFNGTPYEYLPPAKINEVIQILNDVYAGIRSNQPEAANCKIKFCPAMNYRLEDNTLQSLACTDQGITYYGITYNVQGESDINLPDGFLDVVSDVPSQDFVFPYQTYFPVEEFMGFYIFDLLNNPTAAGSASSVTFGSAISYIKLRRVIVGSNNSITRYEGYTAPHEAGHYFGLDHTWGGIYSNDSCGVGDYIYDTPPHAGQNMDCNELSNTCPDDDYNDPVHNIMNYTSDGCRNHFTKGQAEWMHAVIQTYLTDLPYLNTEDFDIYCDPIPCIENASIEGPAENIRCTGEANIEVFVNTATDFSLSVYDNTTSMLIYELEKIDFTPCDNNYCVDFNFTTAGTYELILNVEAETTYSQTYERIYTIIDCDTLDQNLDRAHWHFDYKANLDFTSGLGQLGETEIHALPAEVSVCSPTGELLFYTNGRDVWNRNHEMQSTQLDGNFEASKGIIALDFGENAGTRKYMMVYLDNNFNLYYRFIEVDASYNISFAPSQTQLITSSDLTNLNLELDAMGVSASPKPDETGYWLLSSLKSTTSENYFPISVEIDLTAPYTGSINTSSAILSPSTAPLQSEFETTIKMSPNGKYVVYCSPYGSNVFLIFNAQTGEFNPQTECHIENIFAKFYEVAFSKDSRYMYMTELTDTTSSNSIDSLNMFYRIKQVDLEAVDMCACNLYGKIIFETNSLYDHTYYKTMFYLQEGPDDRIYFSRYSDIEAYSKYMGIIMHPENAATFDPTDNECGVFGDFINYPSNKFIKNDLYLPNFVDAKPDTCDLDFTICSSNCDELEILNLSHGEDSSFTWTLDNGANSYQFSGYTPGNLSSLPYSDTWTITLSQTGCTDSLTDIVILNGVNADITGNDTICNDGQSYIYSCSSGISTYHWSLNGTPFPIFEQNTDVIITGEDYSSYVGSTMSLTLYVTNQFGCESWDTLNIYVTGFGYDVISSSDCSQPISGQVQINITGDAGTNYYADIDGNNYPVIEGVNDLFTGLYPGMHTYAVSDNFCLYQGEFETYSDLLVENTVISTFCPQDTSTITVYISGGNSPYIVTYNSVTDTITEDSITIAGLSNGNFNLSIIDSFGCELDTTLTMAYNYPSIDFYMSGENYCSNDNNVNLVGIVEGGTPAYTYQWGGYQHPYLAFGSDNLLEEIMSYPEAIYLTVTDANGCQVIDSIDIPSVINSDINLAIETTQACGETLGWMDLTVTATDSISEQYWLIPGGDTIFNQEDIYNLTNEGIYRYIAIDEFGCNYYALGLYYYYDEPIVQQPMCSWVENTGSITTNWSWPEVSNLYYTSNWLTNELNDSIPENNGCFDNLPGGTYVLHHTDEQGCFMTDTIIINELDSLGYSVDVEYYSDSEGNPLFTSTISVWGESLPYDIVDHGPGSVHTCYGACDFTVIQDTEQPAVYQVTGNLNECPGTSDTIPYFQLFPSNYECGTLFVNIFDSIPNFHDTIYFDTIVKPLKCLAQYDGALQIFNISTEQGMYPVFFATTNDTLVFNGLSNDTLNLSELGTGTFTVSYWNAYSSVNSFTVTIDEIWDMTLSGTIPSGTNLSYSDHIIAAGQINIESGASLTLTNCEIYTAYYDYTSISQTLWNVKNGGKLYMSHDTIMAGCPDKMWQGIKVTGQNTTQNTYTHGYVEFYESYIEDAMVAIQSITGGIIKARYSKFKNNRYGLYFSAFNYNHTISLVYKNDFITDKYFNNFSYYPKAHVYLFSVKNIVFNGNNFSNTLPWGLNPVSGNYYDDYRGYGISAYYSSFKVTDINTTFWTPISPDCVNTFQGLYYGIYAKSQKTYAPSIYFNTFTDNFRGVNIQSTTGSRIVDNNFETTNANVNLSYTPIIINGTPASTVSYGAYINSCQDYSVEENFVKNGDAGIYIYNTGDAGGLNLYRNTFGEAVTGSAHDMTSASVIVGRNSDYNSGIPNSGQTGLQVRCNDFIDNNTAIGVVNGNMRKNQGDDSDDPADLSGNQFHKINTNSWDFTRSISASYSQYNLGTYNYYQHDDDQSENNGYDRELSTNISGVVGITEDNVWFNSTSTCLSNYTPTFSFEFGMLTGSISDFEQELNILEKRYDSIVDLGDTEYAKAVATLMDDKSYVQAYEILNNEGYLTDTVLIAILCNEIAPSAAIVAILIENSPLPDKVIKLIDEVSLEGNLKELLMAYQTGLNARVSLEYQISDIQQEIYHLETKMMNHAMNNDTTPKVRENIISYFEKHKSDSYNAYINIYKLQQANSDFKASLTTVSELRSFAAKLSEEKSKEVFKFCDVNEVFLEIIDDLEKDTKYLESKKELLYDAALDESPMYSALAEILYEYATDSEFTEYTPLPWDEISPKSVKTTANTENVFKPELKVYPNPTSGLLFVEYDFSKTYSEGYDLLLNAMSLIREGDCNKGEIVVYSEDGRLLQTIKLNMTADIKTILMTDYTPGLYIIEISDCYGNKNSVKITKTK